MPSIVDVLLDIAANVGDLSPAEVNALAVIRPRPRIAAFFNNLEAALDTPEGRATPAYVLFERMILVPLRPWLATEVNETELREQHAANVAASIATEAGRAVAEGAARAKAAANDLRFLHRFKAFPKRLAEHFLRRVHRIKVDAAEAQQAKLAAAHRAGSARHRGSDGILTIRS